MLVVQADDGGSVSITAQSFDTVDEPAMATASADIPAGAQGSYLLHFSGANISLEGLGVTAVDPPTRSQEAGVAISPNPAFGRVTVAWDVPRAGDGAVALYDVSGRCVSTIYSGRMEPGRHTADLAPTGSAGRLLPGLYFVRLSLNGQTRAARFVLLGGF
jgi:hypothetical protein